VDTLTFISSVAKTLVWPGVVLVLVWYLKQPVADLLPTISQFRYGGLQIDFGRELREVSDAAEKTLPRTEKAEAELLSPASSARQQFQQIAKVDPSAAVLVAWRHLEQASRRAAQRYDIRPNWQTLKVLQALHVQERIDDRTYQIFRGMRDLRNQAAHEDAGTITEAEALVFGDLAIRLAAKLDEA
jgi:hypothetical protein